VPLLVTSEHSARGIDFKGVDCVFLIGLPQRVESYIHVAGRTAREGRKGRAVCLLTDDDDVARLDAFRRELGISVEIIDVRFLKG
jgi:superfamily II DNA/RNA helicase